MGGLGPTAGMPSRAVPRTQPLVKPPRVRLFASFHSHVLLSPCICLSLHAFT